MELHAVAQWLIICDTLENALSQIPLCDTFPAQVFRSECFSLLFSFASTFRHPSIEPFCHCTMYHYMNNVHWEGSLFPKEKKERKKTLLRTHLWIWLNCFVFNECAFFWFHFGYYFIVLCSSCLCVDVIW